MPAALLLVLAFISCDDDFNTIGGELIGGQLDSLPQYEAGVVSYSQKIGPVQTNNLPSNLLGVYDDPVYGTHSANVLAQVSLSVPNPTFGAGATLDSVILVLPYFNTEIEADEDGNRAYRLDSVYGNAPFRLSMSRSNFFLNDFDPEDNFENRQRYYSDQGPLFENNLVGDALYVNESFTPSPREVVYFEDDESTESDIDTVRVAPRLRAHLPVEFFQENIIDKQGSTDLINNNNFKDFLRGFYFQAEPVNDDGTMMLLDFTNSDAGIQLYYSFTPEGDDEEEQQGSYELNFGPNRVNTFSQDFPAQIEEAIEASDEETGAENIYLKGGEGSMAVIELFEDEAELEELQDNNWLINEANLVFHVNQNIVEGGEAEPERIYLFNMETNQPLIDFQFDPTFNEGDPANSATSHLGPLVRDEDENGIRYRIRITEHVKNILQGNSTNVKLGLIVSENINLFNNSALKTPVDGLTRVPSAMVISPKGTVLHGNLSPDDEKRLKFNIFYTETND